MYLIEYRIVLVTFFIVAGTTACVTCRRDLTFVPSAAAVFSGLDLFTAAFVTSHPCLCDSVMATSGEDAQTSLKCHIDAHLWCDEGERLYAATSNADDVKGGRQRWQKQIQNSFAKHVPAVETTCLAGNDDAVVEAYKSCVDKVMHANLNHFWHWTKDREVKEFYDAMGLKSFFTVLGENFCATTKKEDIKAWVEDFFERYVPEYMGRYNAKTEAAKANKAATNPAAPADSRGVGGWLKTRGARGWGGGNGGGVGGCVRAALPKRWERRSRRDGSGAPGEMGAALPM